MYSPAFMVLYFLGRAESVQLAKTSICTSESGSTKKAIEYRGTEFVLCSSSLKQRIEVLLQILSMAMEFLIHMDM